MKEPAKVLFQDLNIALAIKKHLTLLSSYIIWNLCQLEDWYYKFSISINKLYSKQDFQDEEISDNFLYRLLFVSSEN